MMALIRSKVPNSTLFRNMILQGHRVDAKEALVTGLVDAVAPTLAELPSVAKELALQWAGKAAAGPVYGYLKEEMYIEASQKLKSGVLSLVSRSTGIPDILTSRL
jgi:enoyl-CoA hydratase/carnithine racemase